MRHGGAWNIASPWPLSADLHAHSHRVSSVGPAQACRASAMVMSGVVVETTDEISSAVRLVGGPRPGRHK